MAEENKNIKGKINELAVLHTDAYALAVANGFKGTIVEWLNSLVGKSAYEIAVKYGFDGTEKEWIDSIVKEITERAEAFAGNAAASATAAKNANDAASAYEKHASEYASQARSSEQTAASAKNAAESAAANAIRSESNAKASEDNAKASETNAKASEESAKASADNAAESASTAHVAGYNAAAEAISDLKISWNEEKESAIAAIESAKQEMIDAVEAEIEDEREAMLEAIERAAEIVQTTGDSETAVMSQKAVTAEMGSMNERISQNEGATTQTNERVSLNGERIASIDQGLVATNNRVSRNSKRITNIEQGLVPDPFETDDSVAYMKGVPANALPYAEIQKVGGMTVKDETTGTLKSAPVTEVVSVGANLIPFSYKGLSTTDNGLSFVANNDGSITVKGTATAATTIALCNLPKLENGDYYLSGAKDGVSMFVQLKKGNAWVDELWVGNKAFALDYINYDTVIFMLYVANGVTVDTTIYPMLNKGLEEFPFRPYTENTFLISESVRAIGGYGDGVSADCYNYIDLESKKFVKRVDKVDLGTLPWYYASGSYSYVEARYKPNANVVCAVPSRFGRIYIDGEGTMVATYVANSFATSAEVKAALSGVMLCYELATPESSDISDLIDNFIEVEPNGTLTFENEHHIDVPSTVVYQLKGVSE